MRTMRSIVIERVRSPAQGPYISKRETMDWHDVLPQHEAEAQKAWERREQMRRAWREGASIADIAKAAHLSKGRVRQIINGRRGESPLEAYLERRPHELYQMARQLFGLARSPSRLKKLGLWREKPRFRYKPGFIRRRENRSDGAT
jgi:hypothetical protein